MDGKSTAIAFSSVPDAVAYKDALKSSADFIKDTRKIEIVPTSSGAFGPGTQTVAMFDIVDSGQGSFLHPDSVYVTCDIKTVTAVGGDTGTASACFNSSANDVIDRVVVRGAKSRVTLADCREFGVYSAMRDRLRYPNAFAGDAPWSRGFPKKAQSKYDGDATGNAINAFNVNYGIGSRAPDLVAELGAGSRRFKIEMKYCPFFANSKIYPLASSGGFTVELSFARVNDAFVGHSVTNAALATTTLDYRVTNLRLHATVSYMDPRFMTMINSRILENALAIPYESYVALSHRPQSNNETLRLSSNLEHMKSVMCVHRLTADLNSIGQCSLGNFGNPKLTEIQLSSAGIVHPTRPLVVTTTNGTKVTGAMVEELTQAAEYVDPELKGKDLQLEQDSMEVELATSTSNKTTIANEVGPKLTEVKNWNGNFIVGLKTDSSSPYGSIFNRRSSTESTKADINATLKYEASPSNYTATFFLHHSNVMRMNQNGNIYPELLTF